MSVIIASSKVKKMEQTRQWSSRQEPSTHDELWQKARNKRVSKLRRNKGMIKIKDDEIVYVVSD